MNIDYISSFCISSLQDAHVALRAKRQRKQREKGAYHSAIIFLLEISVRNPLTVQNRLSNLFRKLSNLIPGASASNPSFIPVLRLSSFSRAF